MDNDNWRPMARGRTGAERQSGIDTRSEKEKATTEPNRFAFRGLRSSERRGILAISAVRSLYLDRAIWAFFQNPALENRGYRPRPEKSP
jgi:hypothetical protein